MNIVIFLKFIYDIFWRYICNIQEDLGPFNVSFIHNFIIAQRFTKRVGKEHNCWKSINMRTCASYKSLTFYKVPCFTSICSWLSQVHCKHHYNGVIEWGTHWPHLEDKSGSDLLPSPHYSPFGPKLSYVFNFGALLHPFYHGPDVSRAMVMWPPCWKVTDSLIISLNWQEQTCPSPAEGRAPP